MSLDHSQNIIEVKDISFSYQDNLVIEDISLTIHKGDYLGIIGPNGGGKTTLVKVMVGLLQPIKGSVTLFGQPLHSFTQWSKIGYVAQNAIQQNSNFPATVEEVVLMGRFGRKKLFQSLDETDRQAVTQALQQVGLGGLAKRRIGSLSGGQQQRVLIARALAAEPEIIFLDEPTTGVDPQTREQFYALLQKLHKDMGLTLVLISHDMDVIANETTEVACINKTLLYESDPHDLKKNAKLHTHYGEQVQFITHTHFHE